MEGIPYQQSSQEAWSQKARNMLVFLFAMSLLVVACSTKRDLEYTSEEPVVLPEEFLETAEDKGGELPQFDIPIVYNDSVEYWMEYFQTRGQKWFQIWLERSGRYIPFMRSVLREYDLPEDLVYLAMIESGFSSRAYSRARAVGHWQFMRSTGRLYGLEVDFWRDERRDPEKASIAAARHLRDLYDRFGDWKLAAAAYNAGIGRVSRAIRRYRTDDYWELRRRSNLARETKNYVPKLIAATIIAKDPERYGFKDIQYQAPLEYDKVVLEEPVNLELLAEKADYDLDSINELNPELNHAVTPPGVKNYELRVPRGTSETFMTAYHSIDPDDRFQYRSHRVRRGDTIYGLARQFGVPQSEILRLNNIRSAHRLQIGQRLVLPVPEGIEMQRASVGSSSSQTQRSGPTAHRVRRGDNLWRLSRRYGTSIAAIKQANNFSRDRLYIGERLEIPAPGAQAQKSGEPQIHRVGRGDNLWKLSRRYGVTISAIKAANGIARNRLYVGEELKIPAAGQSGQAVVHVVRRGETLWSIAQRYGTSIRQIKSSNGLRFNTIHPGKKLKIPSS